MVKKARVILLLILFSGAAIAQQVGMYEHAFFKPMVYNPAFTGNSESTNAMLLSRSQWSDFKGAPRLNLFSLDGNFMDNKMGAGITLISDRKGISNRIGGAINYSYRLNFNDNAYMRFGVAVGVIDQTINFSKALVEDGSDPTLFGDSQRNTAFDINAGIAFIWKGLELGVSAPQLAGNNVNYVDDTTVRAHYAQVRHYLGMLKYSIPLSKDKGIFIVPQALVRYTPNAPLQYDGTLNFEWKDEVWIGATYKSDYAVSAHAGICVHKQLYIGYAYDIILGDLSKYSGSSQEIMVNFKFGKNKREDAPVPVEETKPAVNEAYQKRLDSLQSVIKEDQDKISENSRQLKQLNDKLDQQAKEIQQAKAQQPAGQAGNQPSGVQESNGQQSGSQQPKDQQSPGTNTQANGTNTQASNNNAPAKNNENQNARAVETSPNKTLDNGVWFVTNNTKEYKDAHEHVPKKGYYVVAGTFVYRDFAQAEVKRLKGLGFSNTNWIYYEPKQFNYVFISKPSTKEEAMKKAGEARAAGIKDAWVLQLTE